MQTLVSVFENLKAAQRAVDRLIAAGFEPSDVHLQLGAAPANSATATSPRADPNAETGAERGVLSSIGHFFASVFDEDAPQGGYADRYAEALRRGHPAVMVEARDDEEVDRASTILDELGAFDVDERIAQWRDQAGMGASSPAGGGTGTGDRRGVRLFQRESGRPLRDLAREHEERAPDRPIINRPASTEGESRVIDRGERERAVASDPARDANAHESDSDSDIREPKANAPRRDG